MEEKGIAMYYVFQIVDVIAFVMMFFMLAVIINQQPSGHSWHLSCMMWERSYLL